MYNHNDIIITPVANGFIVTLPGYESEDMISKVASSFQNTLRSFKADPVLDSLQNSPAEPPDQSDLKREQNVHIFSSFKEVLDFLSFTINE